MTRPTPIADARAAELARADLRAQRDAALAEVRDLLRKVETLEVDRARMEGVEAVAADVMQHCNEAIECPFCGNDGCSPVDSENEHDAHELCGRLATALVRP